MNLPTTWSEGSLYLTILVSVLRREDEGGSGGGAGMRLAGGLHPVKLDEFFMLLFGARGTREKLEPTPRCREACGVQRRWPRTNLIDTDPFLFF